MPNITAGPQGTTGYAEGRPRVHPIIRYWPCLIEREAVAPQIASLSATKSSTAASVKATRAEVSHSISMQVTRSASADCKIDANPIHLFDIAIARSGDKGSSATIGIIARSNEHWKFLQTWLTAERVSNFLSPLRIDAVDRFELPNLSALNFVVHGALRQGLRTDAQGKALGQILLEIPLPSNFALSTSYAESE
jgi:hypothetical protein